MNYGGVGVIIENQEHAFLLHLRDEHAPTMKGQWCLVGGSLEGEEDCVAAAVRETHEETGLTLHAPTECGSFEFNNKKIAVVCGSVNTQDEKLALGEGAALTFFSKDEVVALIRSLNYSNPYLDALMRVMGC